MRLESNMYRRGLRRFERTEPVDACSSLAHPIDWNPVAAGGPASAFAAVLAGFVFIGMVYVLTEGFERHHGATLMLFMAAFICLAASSYIGTLVSGEVACLRAWSEVMFASGLLSVGSTAIFGALTWLLPARYGRDPLVRRFVITCALLMALITLQLLTVSVQGFLLDVPGQGHLRALSGWFTLVAIGLVPSAWLLGRTNAVVERRRIASAASAVLLFASLSLVFLAPIGNRPKSQWVSPPHWIVLVSTLIPLLGGAFAIAMIVWALPTAGSWSIPKGQSVPRGHKLRRTATRLARRRRVR